RKAAEVSDAICAVCAGNRSGYLIAIKNNSTCLELYLKNLRKLGLYHYMPVCSQNGNFQQLQCFWQSKFSQVCWCVDPFTGKEIK
ncbi:hypothetical protein GH868_30495, partial [Bacillus thuringiensis]|nr:hypothetical protein [Bacillus thuringiensis]